MNKDLAYNRLFENTPILGMIHLAGEDSADRVARALEEMAIYAKEGIDGAIIEDYCGTALEVYGALKGSQRGFKIIRGVNLLGDPYQGFKLASHFGARFIQFDSVQTRDLKIEEYTMLRKKYPSIIVLGGVGFKYTLPTGNPLEQDLEEAKSRCDAIVTTGTGTGVETPLEKLEEYKKLLGDFPLVVGAGITAENAYDQLMIADGAIVGTFLKQGGITTNPVDRERVRNLMNVVRKVRKKKV